MQQPSTPTIAAIATPPGNGGIGIIRVSGPHALSIGKKVFCHAADARGEKEPAFVPRMLTYGHAIDAHGNTLDEAMAVYMPGPKSFTGEDVLEIHAHGGYVLLNTLLARVYEAGAEPAAKGEFTRRAFMNGKLDLSQAEAVAGLINAPTPQAARLALAKLDGLLGRKIHALRDKLELLRQRLCADLDFSEDESEALPLLAAQLPSIIEELHSLLRAYTRNKPLMEGPICALAGRVNAGKSSLMNALLGRNRAIVSPFAGTTRDYLEELCLINGMAVRLVDTAGLRPNRDTATETIDPIEQEGIHRSHQRIQEANLVLLLLDGANLAQTPSFFLEQSLVQTLALNPARCILIWNKADIHPPSWHLLPENLAAIPTRLSLCAKTGEGVEELCTALASQCIQANNFTDEISLSNREEAAIRHAYEELTVLNKDIQHIPLDIASILLDNALASLGDVLGLGSLEDTVNAVFATFCIGK